jgi:hypothetical protein
MKSKIFNFNNPLESTLYYSAFNFIFSLFLSVFGIFLVWFTYSDFFDISAFLHGILKEIIIYKLPIFLLVVLLFMTLAILTRKSVFSIFLALITKVVMFSYIVGLMTTGIGYFIIVNDLSSGDWLNHLPFSAGYPVYTIFFTLIFWSLLWFITLYLRMHVKGLYKQKGETREDILDILSATLGKHDV